MKQMIQLITLAMFITIMLTGCATNQEQAENGQQNNSWNQPPEMKIDSSKKYSAVIHTSKGEFTVQLFAETAPITVNNFVFLANENFYEGITFHRIMETFMIQTGDPTGTGRGGPGYQFEDELETPHSYEPGIVAMANSGSNTNGSQFFICTGEDSRNLNLAPNYTIFGKVIEGMETVTNIAKTPVTMNPNGGDSSPSLPTEEVTIKSIEIIES
ncbi:peptidylprolyl isomerase [Chengkuizengella sediminis]|uniref:peptidylprolyl isomerase n=1 Tax=Chengkuizengella sediminis TaxID=1885917 RepID=UPI001389D119|nr:peptidylprolyl isomerase [Chengkuizengella sediminis]NDI34518.1 peptidylprolyl isomerase [Chengkuizengella sediminis]